MSLLKQTTASVVVTLALGTAACTDPLPWSRNYTDSV
jgi:hypothetical protein